MVLLLAAAAAHSQNRCRVEPFQGASLPRGAVTQMVVPNNGQACTIINFGSAAEGKNLADSGNILAAPAHGTAEFVAPRARYTPAPGYVGQDEFTYEAFARGSINQQIRLLVTVRVSVVAP
jgi:hypothetical protein